MEQYRKISLKTKGHELIKSVIPFGLMNFLLEKKSRNIKPDFLKPEIYNASGEKMHIYYLKDDLAKHSPYSFIKDQVPAYIFWDRFNIRLNTHFYTQKNVLHTVGKPNKKFALFIEAESILPDDYKIFDKHKGLHKEFDKIFTFSEKILNQFENASFFPGTGIWYGSANEGGVISPDQYLRKDKNISMISSNKNMCKMHSYRVELAKYLKRESLADTYGNFDGSGQIQLAQGMEHYRYSIVVENDIKRYYFTEKILNCFASMTIPIYVGCTDIGKFFNEDGIIKVDSLKFDHVARLLRQCSERDYMERLEAIKDNFNRVQEYKITEDYLFKHYGDILE